MAKKKENKSEESVEAEVREQKPEPKAEPARPLNADERIVARNKIQKYGALNRADANTVVKLSDSGQLRSIFEANDCESCQALVIEAIPDALKPKKKVRSDLDHRA